VNVCLVRSALLLNVLLVRRTKLLSCCSSDCTWSVRCPELLKCCSRELSSSASTSIVCKDLQLAMDRAPKFSSASMHMVAALCFVILVHV